MKRLVLLMTLFVSTNIAFSDEPVSCFYLGKKSAEDPSPQIQEHQSCGFIVDGKIVLSKEHVKQIVFDEHGIGSVFIRDQHYYVKPDGSMLPVIRFDNGPDPYSDGLTRSLVNDKIAYYDRNFSQVIAPKYDWGWPFEKGRALVCNECKLQPPDEDGHVAVVGGVWGYINKKGEEVTPVKFTQSETSRM